jgi:hypothetical protein
MKVNYSIRYNIDVMAFRYGLWREVALPLLQIFSKLILFRIVQLNHECKPFIHAYQTSDVMLRVIMMVSHNLDSEIRALFLMLLEGLAAVVREDSHICPFMVVAK